MHALFPPGDTTWKNSKPHSAWREFKFALNQVVRAIEPTIPLAAYDSKLEFDIRIADRVPAKEKIAACGVFYLLKQVSAYAVHPQMVSMVNGAASIIRAFKRCQPKEGTFPWEAGHQHPSSQLLAGRGASRHKR